MSPGSLRERALRAVAAALVAVPGTWALAASPYVGEHVAPALMPLLGPPPDLWWGVLALLALLLGLLGFLAHPRRGGAPALGFAALVALLAGYEASLLGWTWVFLRRAGTPGLLPDAGFLAPLLATLGLALLLGHALAWRALRRDYVVRGVPPEEARAAGRAGAWGALALLGVVGLALALPEAVRQLRGPLALEALHDAAFAYPLAGLLALGALLWLAGRGAARQGAARQGARDAAGDGAARGR